MFAAQASCWPSITEESSRLGSVGEESGAAPKLGKQTETDEAGKELG